MKIQAFLVINNRGNLRVVKQRPYINNNEIAINLNLDIPGIFFDRLIPSVDIKLPEESVLKPDIETIVKITSEEVASKLKLDVNEVSDGLRDMLIKHEEE